MTSIKNGIWTIAGITVGGAVVYSLYTCYRDKGSLAPSKLAECFIEGGASTLFNVFKDLVTEVYKGALKPLAEDIYKGALIPIADGFKDFGNTIDDKIFDPVGDFFKHDLKDGFNKFGHTLMKPGEEAVKGLKKAFSKDSMKKGFKKIFHF